MSFNARWLTSVNGEYPEAGGIHGRWYLAKPMVSPLSYRLRWAWEVVTGRAEIIVWPRLDHGDEDG